MDTFFPQSSKFWLGQVFSLGIRVTSKTNTQIHVSNLLGLAILRLAATDSGGWENVSLVFISCAKDNLIEQKKSTDDGTLQWSVKILWIIVTILIFHSDTNGQLSDGHYRNRCNYTKSLRASAGSVVVVVPLFLTVQIENNKVHNTKTMALLVHPKQASLTSLEHCCDFQIEKELIWSNNGLVTFQLTHNS